MQQPPYKICPHCRQAAALETPVCGRCGHQYRTQFVPPIDQTQVVMPPEPTQMVTPVPGPLRDGYPSPAPFYTGAPLPRTIRVFPGTHSVVWAVILSFILVGLGQMYNRQIAKGVALLLGSIALACLTFGISLLATWPINLIDADMIASRLNRGEAVGEWQWF